MQSGCFSGKTSQLKAVTASFNSLWVPQFIVMSPDDNRDAKRTEPRQVGINEAIEIAE